jgi:cation:H+ antiporter
MIYVLFIIGFVLLVKGADWLVEGSSSLAKRYNISDFVIGLTIVSMGTSMPELLVNVMASFSGNAEIAIGNIVGSNISNILLILGVSALIYPLAINRATVFAEIPYSLLATFVLAFLANASVEGDYEAALSISRYDGLILLFFFALFILYVIRVSKDGKTDLIEADTDIEIMPLAKSITLIVVGSIGLFLGGKWVVDGATHIAIIFELSKEFIGLTVVAIGTSLPELVTSAMAAYKKNTDIAVANVLGSNIFNLMWVLGVSATIRPMLFNPMINADILVLIIATLFIFIAMVIGKRNSLDRINGIFFLFVYVIYMVYLVNRG